MQRTAVSLKQITFMLKFSQLFFQKIFTKSRVYIIYAIRTIRTHTTEGPTF